MKDATCLLCSDWWMMKREKKQGKKRLEPNHHPLPLIYARKTKRKEYANAMRYIIVRGRKVEAVPGLRF